MTSPYCYSASRRRREALTTTLTGKLWLVSRRPRRNCLEKPINTLFLTHLDRWMRIHGSTCTWILSSLFNTVSIQPITCLKLPRTRKAFDAVTSIPHTILTLTQIPRSRSNAQIAIQLFVTRRHLHHTTGTCVDPHNFSVIIPFCRCFDNGRKLLKCKHLLISTGINFAIK